MPKAKKEKPKYPDWFQKKIDERVALSRKNFMIKASSLCIGGLVLIAGAVYYAHNGITAFIGTPDAQNIALDAGKQTKDSGIQNYDAGRVAELRKDAGFSDAGTSEITKTAIKKEKIKEEKSDGCEKLVKPLFSVSYNQRLIPYEIDRIKIGIIEEIPTEVDVKKGIEALVNDYFAINRLMIMPDSLTLDENREASIQRASILYQIAQKCPKEKNKIYELALRIVESHRAFYSYSSRSLPKVKARNDYKITFSLYNELCLALGRVPKTR